MAETDFHPTGVRCGGWTPSGLCRLPVGSRAGEACTSSMKSAGPYLSERAEWLLMQTALRSAVRSEAARSWASRETRWGKRAAAVSRLSVRWLLLHVHLLSIVSAHQRHLIHFIPGPDYFQFSSLIVWRAVEPLLLSQREPFKSNTRSVSRRRCLLEHGHA